MGIKTNLRYRLAQSVSTAAILAALSLLVMTENAAAQLAAGDTIGIDFASPDSVFPEDPPPTFPPAPGTNFNAFDLQTDEDAIGIDENGDPDLTDVLDQTASLAAGTLTRTSDGATVLGVGFSVTNNAGKATGLTGIEGQAGLAPFDDASIGADSYGAANVGNDSRADFGALLEDANLVFTFSGLDDSLTYSVTGGYLHGTANDNFNTTWDIDGQTATTANESGLDDAGYVTLTDLATNGSGDLEITVTRSIQLFVAGLTLTAIDAMLPELPSLEVNIDTGIVNIIGASEDLDVQGYSITSAAGQLNPDGWASLQDHGFSGVNTDSNGNNTDPNDGIGWEELGDGTSSAVGEFNLQGSSVFGPGGTAAESLGLLFTPQSADGDLQFELSIADGSSVFAEVNYVTGGDLAGDFDGDSDVDGADFLVWQRDGLSLSELVDWRRNYGASASLQALTVSIPEPTALVLATLALPMFCMLRGFRA